VRKTRNEAEEKVWLKAIKKKVETEMAKKELDTILYWKGEAEKILAKKPASLGTMQVDLHGFILRMQNRIKVVKSTTEAGGMDP
jgi:hypothetical protein